MLGKRLVAGAMENIEIRVSGNEIRFIYRDDLRSMLNIGSSIIKRVSHVEPDSNGNWVADMSPVNGPKLGPFSSRKEALEREVLWLLENKLPTGE